MAPFKVHMVRFYEPDPQMEAIHSMSLSYDGQYLALSRKDNSIEIWDVFNLPTIKTFIPQLPDVQLEQVAWFENRLFGCGLNGFLYEFDYHKLEVKASYAVTSGPAWCLSVCKATEQIAVGTESGFVSIFNIVNDGLDFHRTLDKQQERVLCLAWHPLGTKLATGSLNTIRVYDPKTGNFICRMTIGSGSMDKNKQNIVWCLLMTNDSIIVSGDDCGRTSFWDGETGAHMRSVMTHKADILTLAINNKGNKMWSAGVDPTIQRFDQMQERFGGEKKWVKGSHRRGHNHDIRCIQPIRDDGYYSGGTDTQLVFSNHVKKLTVTRMQLELWKLGEAEITSGQLDKNLPVHKDPIKILQLTTPNEESLVCSSISKSGKLLAYATKKRFRVFKLGVNNSEDGMKLKKLKLATTLDAQPQCMRFYKIGKKHFILCGYGTPKLECFSIANGAVTADKCLQGSEELLLTSSIQFIAVAGSTAVVTDFSNQAVAVDLNKMTLISKLPVISPACITAVTLSPDGKTCVLTYSDQQLAQIDVETAKFTPFCNAFNQAGPPPESATEIPISGVNYIKDDMMLLYDLQNITIIDQEEEIREPYGKRHMSEANHDDSQDGSMRSSSPTLSNHKSINVSKKVRVHAYPDLIAAVPLASDEIVCVELSEAKIHSKLPASFEHKRFGAK